MARFFRLTAFLLLAMAAWNPAVLNLRAPVDCFVLLDDSYSMADKLDAQTWGRVRDHLRTLPKGSRLAMIRYARQSVLEMPPTAIDDPRVATLLDSPLPPRQSPMDQSATNLEQAINFAARLLEPQRAASWLIIHDDRQTSGDASAMIRQLRQQGHRLFQINLAANQPVADAWIQSLKAPLYAMAGQSIPVIVTAQGSRDMDGILSIYVNDRLQARQPLRLFSSQPSALRIDLPGCLGDVCLIKAQLEAENDAVAQNNQRQWAITVDKTKPVLYIRHQKEPSALTATLAASGEAVEVSRPDACLTMAERFKPYAAVMLEDVAIGMMPARCWQALTRAVENLGVGLMVLGGPNSFAAGAYRHSLLEDLLPVTSEASTQSQASTLLFLIDKSGSMDSDNTGPNRIAIARQAVIESVAAQGPQDSFGLISFDAQPHLHIPISHYDDPVAEIEAAFNLKAKGGTRLKPALDFAIEELAKASTETRILVLLTDGILDRQDLAAVERKVVEKNVTVIALAIGKDAQAEKLRRLTAHNGGHWLRVDRIIELPVLLRKELDQRRDPVMTGRISVKQKIPLPFMNSHPVWPDVLAYMVTKAKPESRVFLESGQRDPLLAMRYAGTGKVVALPAGLGEWAGDWMSWREWGRFVQGLVRWVSISARQPQIDVKLMKSGDEMLLQADAITLDRAWQTDASASLSMTHANGRVQSQALNMTAPGQYVGKLPLNEQGLYTVGIRIGELNTSFSLFNETDEEFLPPAASMANRPALSALIPDGRQLEGIEMSYAGHARNLMLTGALLFYLLHLLLANKLLSFVALSHLSTAFRRWLWSKTRH